MSEAASTTVLGLALIASVLALLVICPSRAGLWRAIKYFAEDHEEANMLIDRRKAARKTSETIMN